MKKSDKVKKGLETCIGECTGNKPHCPYHTCGNGCMDTMNKDTCAYVQQLEAQSLKWISVGERLPDEGEKVIVRHPDGSVRTSTFRFDRWWGRDHKHIGFRVVYWMPLPEPPKEDDHV